MLELSKDNSGEPKPSFGLMKIIAQSARPRLAVQPLAEKLKTKTTSPVVQERTK